MDHPIKFHEHLQLTSLGIRLPTINFANVTMESEKFIVCREKVDDGIVIVDMAEPSKPKRLPLAADSVIMHPRRQIMAVRSGRIIQIFDLEKVSKVKEHEHNEDVVFWKWIDEETIGVVTETAVYHWSLTGAAPPAKIFDRHPSMSGCQIINYRADAERKWLILIGLTAKTTRIAGSMQLYSVERGISQPIEGHAACFLKLKLDGNPHPSNLFVFSVKNEQGGKLVIIELGTPVPGNVVYQKKGVDVPFSDELVGEFPIALQASTRQGVVYLVTKHGFVHIFDVDTGTMIYSNRISAESIFITAEFSKGGFVGINRKGQVLSVSLDEQKMIDAVFQSAPELARKLNTRWNTDGIASNHISIRGSTSTPDRRSIIDHSFEQLSIALPTPSPQLQTSPSNLLSIKRDDSPSLDRYSPLSMGRVDSPDSSLPPPSSLLFSSSALRREDAYNSPPQPLYSIKREASPALDNYASPSNLSTGLYGSPVQDSYVTASSLPLGRRYDPMLIETNNNVESNNAASNARAEKAEKERDEIETLYKELLTRHSAAKERAEKAEKEREEIAATLRGFQALQADLTARTEKAEKKLEEFTARYEELSKLHADLTARVQRTEKEREYFATRNSRLERKCRDAMTILGRAEEQETQPVATFDRQETKIYQPINWNSLDSNSESSRKGILPDFATDESTNYSSLFDD